MKLHIVGGASETRMSSEQSELNEFVSTISRLHQENQRSSEGLRQTLLDVNERLAVSEVNAKHADQFRLLLFEKLEKVDSKLDSLRDLPRQVTQLEQKLKELTSTVNEHDDTFLQLKGGWLVARWGYMIIAAAVAIIASALTQYLMRKL